MFEFEGNVIEWRGPAPYHFVVTPPSITRVIEETAGHLSYGWGCIPVDVTIGETTFYTALIPREGNFFVPLRVAIRKAESVELGALVRVSISPRN